jgi:hypothetical protein
MEKRHQDPSDNLFRIYHFCFNFEEWASELLQLVDVFVELRSTEEEVAKVQISLKKKWGFLSPIIRILWLRRWSPSGSKNASVRHQFGEQSPPLETSMVE